MKVPENYTAMSDQDLVDLTLETPFPEPLPCELAMRLRTAMARIEELTPAMVGPPSPDKTSPDPIVGTWREEMVDLDRTAWDRLTRDLHARYGHWSNGQPDPSDLGARSMATLSGSPARPVVTASPEPAPLSWNAPEFLDDYEPHEDPVDVAPEPEDLVDLEDEAGPAGDDTNA